MDHALLHRVLLQPPGPVRRFPVAVVLSAPWAEHQQKADGPSLHERRGDEPYDNWILRCVVVSPAGRPIYRYESPLELLKAHQSLYLDGNILYRDSSENSIITTDPAKADGSTGILVDLDLAKEVGSGRSGARHQTGTREFMAIDVLLTIDHTYRHDFESFFYVLIWQCPRYGWGKSGLNRPKYRMLKESYTGNYEKIANGKRGNMETGGYERIVMKEFPPGFECVKSSCKTARRILFPYGGEGLIVALISTKVSQALKNNINKEEYKTVE
ncbi:predicted protein [Histoplasma mississippiense (nom. inval.)]|uniref:predicted protein n=1 Tax=Ajellomyces capsulatus (strain NAm1 / WU24) TaxID=2059318 RepID=UPI000157C888|nr:predicted protein [Histoplasma mississippiense (nom. inval.)]EDN09411.1 predicted protein [Histoplasma mississippiense (nom. inval.)]